MSKKAMLILFGVFCVSVLALWSIYFFPFSCIRDYKTEGSFSPRFLNLVHEAIETFRTQQGLSACKVNCYAVEKVGADKVCLRAYYTFLGREKARSNKILYQQDASGKTTVSFPKNCD